MPSYRQGEASIAGRTARDFPLRLSGKPIRLSDLRGRVVVLDFWASWCPPCVDEAPSLNRLQKYIESRNAMVLGVAADEDAYAFSKFLIDQGVTFPTFTSTPSSPRTELDRLLITPGPLISSVMAPTTNSSAARFQPVEIRMRFTARLCGGGGRWRLRRQS